MKKLFLLATFCVFFSTSQAQNQQQIDNLKTFAKVYGYVKYFHPSDEAYDLDWNCFAAYGARKIVECKTTAELVSTLEDLFHPIAPTAVFSQSKQDFNTKSLTPNSTKGFKEIYWQHRGVSFQMNNQNNVYQSVRVNKDREVDEAAGFGNLVMSLDAEAYKGKQIKYTGWVKLENGSKGDGHLWLRVDNSDNTMGFFENMDSNPIKSDEWKEYEIVADVDQMASKIVLGSFLNGKGTLYIDDVHLYYKEGNAWVEIPIANNDFEADQLGERSEASVWLGKSKGYNFDVSEAEAKIGKYCGVIAYEGMVKNVKGDQIFKASLNVGDLINEEVGEGIYAQIPLVLYGNSQTTFPVSNTYTSLNKTLESVDINASNLGLRLANVINTYNVFQHFYPYFDDVEVDWEQQLEIALKRSFGDTSAKDHLITLQKFTAPLKDGHIRVWGADLGQYAPEIQWQWIDNALVITEVNNDSIDLKVGDIVSKINGQSPQDYFDEHRSRVSAGTQGWLDYRVETISLVGDNDSSLNLEVNGQLLNLKRDKKFSYSPTKIPIQEHEYKKLESDIYYLNLSSISMETIKTLLPELETSAGIICDLRGYPNGNHELISHLLKEKDTTKGWMKIPRILRPNQEHIIGYDEYDWAMKPAKPYLGTNKVVFIVDGRAISYAESYMGYIEGYDLAAIVGQPTAGTNGNINPFKLLGGFGMSWTGMKVVKHDGSQHHAVGILPDVYVEKSIEGVKEGRDEFLEAAIDIILKK